MFKPKGLLNVKRGNMITRHCLLICFFISISFLFAEDLVLPDTIIFKEGATLPPSIKSMELKCAIVSETETTIKIDRSIVKGISDFQEFPKEIVADIRRADLGERRYQEIKSTFKMPEDSQEVAYYNQILEEDLEPFISKFEKSQYLPEVQKMIGLVRAELEKLYIGQVRRGDRWFSSQEWKDYQKEYEPVDLFKKIEAAKVTQDLASMLELSKKITTDHSSVHFPEVVKKTIDLYGTVMEGFTADAYVNRFKDELVLLEGRLDTQKALLVDEKDKAEKKAIQSRVRELEKQKVQMNTQITQVQKSFADLQKKMSDEADRLRKIDLKKKMEALQVLEGAQKLKGNPEAVEGLVGEIQKAAKLWAGCTGLWSFALDEATARVDDSVKALSENRLSDAETELKKANTILNAAGSLPAGVGSVKKLIIDNLRFFSPARSLAETVNTKDWDKFSDKYAQLEKALIVPKPLDYPVTHRFAKATEGWMLSQKKEMDGAMEESDALVATFYSEVKTVGFIVASEYLLKAKTLWSQNPKIPAANAEFKGELEKIEKEKKVASFKPMVAAFEEAFAANKMNEAEAAMKKLEAAYASHPELEQMKFKVKNEKEKIAIAEKARREEAERIRLEEEKKEKQKQMIINVVIVFVLLLGGAVGFLIWKKKRDAAEESDSTNNSPPSDSPPTVS